MSGGEEEESFRVALDQFFHEHVETFQLLYHSTLCVVPFAHDPPAAARVVLLHAYPRQGFH